LRVVKTKNEQHAIFFSLTSIIIENVVLWLLNTLPFLVGFALLTL
jgi:hypothetical protein